MQIDWLIVGAQLLNFVVLVALLRRFLYRPVLAAMERREQHIAQRLRAADDREQRARETQERYEAQLAQVATRREELLKAARQEADAERHELRERARAEVEATEARWRSDLQREQGEFLVELRREIAATAQAVAGQILTELADADLQQRMTARLLTRLDTLEAGERTALAGGPEGVTVRTAWPLDDAARTQIEKQFRQRLGRQVPVHWQRDDTLVCGLSIEGSGHRLAWDLADRLDTLAQRLRERLATLAGTPSPTPASDLAADATR